MLAASTSPVYCVPVVPRRLQTPPSQSLFVKFRQKLGPAARARSRLVSRYVLRCHVLSWAEDLI